jgi:eukaryotic-like serine/threonine-protein kinase
MTAPLLPALPGYDDPQLIAHGTTALVFRAIQTRLNRPVAIKVITTDTDAGSVPVNVERELATTVALSSQPHIVSIIDTGVTDDDRRYIVMEYCEGGSYAQILRHNGPLPVDDVVEVGIKIGQALHAAHEAGIVHRDVKPSNILRSRFGPALTDFGIARAPDELGGTLTREMMTPHHASPEALLHQAQSGLSDVYSLASTMWTLLVGHPPFVDPARPDIDMYQFRDRVLHDPLPAMPREDVPEWLVAEVRRAMAKLPAQRHGSALDFSEALQRGALGIEAPPGSTRVGAVGATPPPRPQPPPARVHSPGVPAQAWPTPPPAPPIAPPPVAAPPVAAPPPAPPVALPPPVAPPPAAPPPLRQPPVAAPPAPMAPAADEGPIYRPPATPASVRPSPATHPLGAPDQPSGPTPVEEGGWLPRVNDVPTSPWPEVELDPIHPRPRRDHGVIAPSGGRRGGLLAVLVGVTVIAVVSGVLLFLRSDPEPQTAPSAATTTPPATADSTGEVPPTQITAGTSGAPTDVRIEDDGGATVTLAWTDPAGGSQSYLAVAYLSGSDDAEQYKSVPSGAAQMSVTFTGLDPALDYCFTIGVVRSVTEVSAAPPVCTER